MFHAEHCITELLLNGSYFFHAGELAERIDLSHVQWLKDEANSTPFFWANRDAKLEQYMAPYTALLRQVYSNLDVEKMWYCNGVEDSSRPWHSDLLEGIDVSILCYLSSMSPAVGGHIGVRNTVTGDSMKLYPQFGDCLILRHAKGWEHQAEPATVDRLYVNCTYKNARV